MISGTTRSYSWPLLANDLAEEMSGDSDAYKVIPRRHGIVYAHLFPLANSTVSHSLAVVAAQSCS